MTSEIATTVPEIRICLPNLTPDYCQVRTDSIHIAGSPYKCTCKTYLLLLLSGTDSHVIFIRMKQQCKKRFQSEGKIEPLPAREAPWEHKNIFLELNAIHPFFLQTRRGKMESPMESQTVIALSSFLSVLNSSHSSSPSKRKQMNCLSVLVVLVSLLLGVFPSLWRRRRQKTDLLELQNIRLHFFQ